MHIFSNWKDCEIVRFLTDIYKNLWLLSKIWFKKYTHEVEVEGCIDVRSCWVLITDAQSVVAMQRLKPQCCGGFGERSQHRVGPAPYPGGVLRGAMGRHIDRHKTACVRHVLVAVPQRQTVTPDQTPAWSRQLCLLSSWLAVAGTSGAVARETRHVRWCFLGAVSPRKRSLCGGAGGQTSGWRANGGVGLCWGGRTSTADHQPPPLPLSQVSGVLISHKRHA